ncbi:hypothetical protein [Paenibacillus sp. N3.4]|uniref:hypothetical protein n=1 Tax=Paenibacillus sp. N3.4 TaxID=2603222 RepID=UPI0011C94326|nr:hypothetical protein [Paenibacillus sp. N3.4]TXK85152.1 hypothetical protein FU659_05250 [Paenibacillus sp. N3.4]
MHLFESHPHQEAVLRFSPLLYMDRFEPFTPIRVGVTVFETSAHSSSFDRNIRFNPDKIRMVIEYAIYWDYDIQHIYDLEHVWVYVDHEGCIASCEVSFHGRYLLGLLRDHSNLSEDHRVKLFVQPGKHAMSPLEDIFHLLPNVESCCQAETGIEGVLEPSMFSGEFKAGEDIDRIAEEHLRTFSFQPSFDYVPHTWAPDTFVSWGELRKEIPVRLKSLLATLT